MLKEIIPLPGRQQDILRYALQHQVVKIKDLAAELGVHEMTVRRDIDALCEQGKLLRVHGGAQILEHTSEEVSQQLRAGQHVEAKEKIARAALNLLQDGDTVALDASTTSLALARLLPMRRVQAIACSLDAANTLATGGVPFILVGGNFHAPARSFVGAFSLETLRGLHPDFVFFSAKGYSPDAGFTDPHLQEVSSKKALIASGSSVVALVDSSKFGRKALATIATHHDINTFITEQAPDSELRSCLEEDDIHLIVAP